MIVSATSFGCRSQAIRLCILALLIWRCPFDSRIAHAADGGVFKQENNAAAADQKKLDEALAVAEKSVSIRTTALFHKHFIKQCLAVLPEAIELQYDGQLRLSSGRNKTRVEGDGVESALHWSVVSDLSWFSFWVSTTKTSQTVVQCRIDNQDLFVNVDFVDSNRGLDESIPELGKQSVRQVLAKLADKSAKE